MLSHGQAPATSFGSADRATALRILVGAAITAVLFSLLLLAVRTASALSFVEPLQLITSGDEQSSLFAVWKASRGMPIYVDRFQPPFAHAFFNWLFYESYGGVAAMVRALGGLDDAWLPTVGRLFTLLGVASSAAFAYPAFSRALGPDASKPFPLSAPLAIALAVYVAAGPLIGFWGITVRADVWALALEIAAVTGFLALYPSRRVLAIATAALAAYLAWSFKQTGVSAAGAVGLFLLLRRDWRMLAVFSTMMVAAWGLTLLAGGSRYAATVFFVGIPLEYSAAHAAKVATNFAMKALPALCIALAVVAALVTRTITWKRLWTNDVFVLAASGLAISLILGVSSTAQSGSAENYYFPSNFFLALAGIAGFAIALTEAPGATRYLSALAAAGWIGLAGAVLSVLTGITGVIDVRAQHANYLALKRCLDGLPHPLFVYDRYLSLPWMTPGNEPFVLSYVYEKERALGRTFAGGGIGGMVAAGRFAVVAVPGAESVAALDGAALTNYGPGPHGCAGMAVLHKKAA